MSDISAPHSGYFAAAQQARLQVALASLIATGLFATLLISFEPFASNERFAVEPAGPNPVNQIGFSILCLIAIGGMATVALRKHVAAIADTGWVVIAACLLFSASNASDPAGALRSIAFTLFVVITCAGVLALPHSVSRLSTVLASAILLVLALSYFGILFLPELAIHGPGGAEAQHEGLWRGLFPHKNVAGPVVATFLFVGIYLMRAGNRWTGILIILLSALFVIQTGSRTTNGMIPLAIGTVLLGRLTATRWIPPLAAIALVGVAALFTVGASLSAAIFEMIADYISDPTYTGRTTLWAYGLEYIAQQPWAGYGFDNFWLKPIVTDSFLPIDAEWDYRDIVNGHNNYIDLALFMGVPAAAIVILLLCVRPMFDYARCRPFSENRRLADCFMMILVFVLLNSMLESSWFRRADPTWVMMIIAVLGLRMTSRLNLRPDDNQTR